MSDPIEFRARIHVQYSYLDYLFYSTRLQQAVEDGAGPETLGILRREAKAAREAAKLAAWIVSGRFPA